MRSLYDSNSTRHPIAAARAPWELSRMASIHEHTVKTIDGETKTLEEYEGKVMLIVNTASKCGFTPQFEGLEKLYAKYRERGLVILGFPCNQFASQEPGDEPQIATFCQRNYGVTFPMHGKIEVNGDGTHPLYEELKTRAPGILGSKAIKWNFTKFLVDREGKMVKRFATKTTPAELESEVAALL
jgi:glutathione peroxidase